MGPKAPLSKAFMTHGAVEEVISYGNLTFLGNSIYNRSSNSVIWFNVFCYNTDEKKISIPGWGRCVDSTLPPHVCMGFL